MSVDVVLGHNELITRLPQLYPEGQLLSHRSTPWGAYKEYSEVWFSSLIITNIFPQINTPKSYRKMRYKSVTCEKKS